ncbi:MAG: anthranilate synthase component I [Deltaproteobacteria bacterium]|nr:anthranilate synthase component I [Deltaproteobacteria bacterium]
MIQPGLEKYLQLSKEVKYIPLYTKIMGDSLTPVLVYQTLKELSPYSYLLESVQQNEKLGRFSFIGLDTLLTFKSKGDQIELIYKEGDTKTLQGDPFDELLKVMEEFRPAILDELHPYHGGMMGYFGYDCVRHIEKIPDQAPDHLNMPDSLFVLPRSVIVFDHLFQSITVIVQVPAGDEKSFYSGIKQIGKILDLLSKPVTKKTIPITREIAKTEPEFTANMSRPEYIEAVKTAKNHIIEGDIFQVVLSLRFQMEYEGDPFEVYRSLRRVNPSPYLFYLNYPDFKIAGSSPEILVKRQGDTLTLRPIAGTRKRGATPEEDKALAEELLNDPKEIAEHMMLLDLGRNDLGRICQFGSIRPTDFKVIENYSHVMHIVTNLEGKLAKDIDNADILKACFPAGTLSGAPKVRAMQIIDNLESSRRGFYGGAVVNMDFDGNFDSCISIRSVILKDNTAQIQAGAGIVADSVPQSEYEECLNKAKALMKSIQFARSQ